MRQMSTYMKTLNRENTEKIRIEEYKISCQISSNDLQNKLYTI